MLHRAAVLLGLALAALPLPGRAQEPPDTAAERAGLGLREAIARALARSEEVAAARARLAQAEARVRIARADARPRINALLVYTRTFASPAQDFFGLPDTAGLRPDTIPVDSVPPDTLPRDTLGFGAGRPPGARARPTQAAQPGVPGGVAGQQAGAFLPFSFGAKNSWFAGFILDQALYAGGRIDASIRQAEREADAARALLAQTEADLAYQVKQAYYDAALAEQEVGIARASLALAEEQAELARTRFAAGAVAELDVLRADVERENLVPQLVEAQNRRARARLELERLVEIPPAADPPLTTDICPAGRPPEPETLLPPPDAAEAQILERPAIAAARQQVRARAARVRAARAAYLPSVDLSGTLGWQAFPDPIVPSFDDWDRNWSASITVTLPIYLGGRRVGELRLARAELAEARAELAQEREAAVVEYREAYGEIQRAWTQVLATTRTVESAERIYRLNRLRYQEGAAIQLEVLDALLTLQQARTNLVQSYYDYYSALALAERALGTDVARMTLPTGRCPAPADPTEIG